MRKFGLYISVMVACACLAGAQKMAPSSDARDAVATDEMPMVQGPAKVPTQDLLNMRGAGRPTPLKNVTIEQRLDSQLPLDASFTDEYGKQAPLGAYFRKAPGGVGAGLL